MLAHHCVIYLSYQSYTRYTKTDGQTEHSAHTQVANSIKHISPTVKTSGKRAKPSLTIIHSCNKEAVCICSSLKWSAMYTQIKLQILIHCCHQ